MKIPSQVVEVGKMNRLPVVTKVDFGVYLDGKKYGEILMPRKYVPEVCEVGDFVDVFVYVDSEDRLVATTEEPYAVAGELACLRAVSVTQIGAFLDWGLMKDLFVPFREWKEQMYPDEYYMVYVYFDKKSERLAASTQVHKFVDNKAHKFALGEEVDLIVCHAFEIGYTVIINRHYIGVIYKNEVFQPLEPAQKLKGYIKTLRMDGKIDVQLQQPGDYQKKGLSERILAKLKEEDGFLPVTDKSTPETVYELFQTSKKSYKKAVGHLYKRRIITIDDDGIRLV